MFATVVLRDENEVAHSVLMRYAFSVFAFVVFDDKVLLPFGNVVPVRLESNRKECIASKHELGRSGVGCGMNGGIDRARDGTQNSNELFLAFVDVDFM